MASSLRRAALIALPLLFVLACSAAAPPDGVQRIDRARFGIVDVATPPPDSELSKSVTLPDHWVRTHPGESGIGWYRMTVVLPGDAIETWALYVPSSSSSFEVFVAGEHLGSVRTGGEPNLQNWNRPAYFELPIPLLAEANGTIDLRLWAREGSYRGLGAVEVGPAEQLWPRYRSARFWNVETQWFWMLLGATLVLFATGLWVATGRYPLFACFVWFAVAWLVPTVIQSLTRSPGSFWFGQWLIHVGLQQMAVAAIYLTHRIVDVTRPRLERVALAVSGVAAAALAVAAVFSPRLFDPIANAFHIVAFTSSIYLIWLFVRGRATMPRAERAIFFVCALILFVAAAHDLAAQLASNAWHSLRLLQHVVPIFLVMFFVVLMMRFLGLYRRAERQNEELEARICEKTTELEEHFAQLEQLRREGVLAEERARMTREMHDGMGAQLVSILSLVESGSVDRKVLATALRESLDELRLVIHSLEPTGSEVGTLLALLREQLSPRLGQAGLSFDWQVDVAGDDIELSPERALHLVRIVGEAVTNVLKHANASAVQVATRREARDGRPGAVICISDDGNGMAQVENAEGGRGLENMKERAAALGGSLKVSRGGEGTVVKLWLPERA